MVGDIGTLIKATIIDENEAVVDVSSATTKQLIFKKSDGSTLTANADFFTNGTDGIIQYATVSGDISVAGTYRFQGYVVLSSGSWHSVIYSFTVGCNL